MRQLIGRPAQPPPADLVAALRARCALHPEIRAAYLFQTMFLEPTQPPALAVSIALQDEPAMTSAEVPDDLVRAPLDLGFEPDLVFQVLAPDALEHVSRLTRPFYACS
jgi:SseB protein C-terminal domain